VPDALVRNQTGCKLLPLKEFFHGPAFANAQARLGHWMFNIITCESSPNLITQMERTNGARKIRTLIVDDQLLARELLRRMLKEEPDIDIIGMSTSGREAVDAINQLAPDLVFLDVQMPELDGFAVLAQINRAKMPAIIFVTANDDFALRAFEVHALDYLVKPCTPDRLHTAIQRARDQIHDKQSGQIQQRLTALLEDLQSEPRQTDRLAIKSEGRILFLRLTDIDWVEAADNYVKLHVGQEAHMLRETMTSLETKLPKEKFLRISRSTIVNIEQIKELHPLFHGEYVVVLRSGARLTLTRGYRDKLKALGLS
jgi:two-component system LytT family response regulator